MLTFWGLTEMTERWPYDPGRRADLQQRRALPSRRRRDGSASAVLQAAGASITLLLKGQRWGLWEADTVLLPQPRG